MRIVGVDFTAAPSKRKPIVLASGALEGSRVTRVHLATLEKSLAFEYFLQERGFLRIGIDAPLSMPLEFLSSLGLASWEEGIEWVAKSDKKTYSAAIRQYANAHPAGQKEPKRACDRLHMAASPLKLFNPGVGWMHYALAYRLCLLKGHVLPFSTDTGTGAIVEVYPSVFAKKRIGNASYKNDPAEDPDRVTRRGILVNALHEFLEITPEIEARAIADSQGDVLDALIALAQTAFSLDEVATQPSAQEGWIYGADL